MRVRSCYECFTRTLDFSNTLLNATSLEVPLFFQQPNQYGVMNFSNVKFEHGWMSYLAKTDNKTTVKLFTSITRTEFLGKDDSVAILDVRGVPFNSFDTVSFQSTAVQVLYTDNFRLCCSFLHQRFPTKCIGPPMGPLSSCENILM